MKNFGIMIGAGLICLFMGICFLIGAVPASIAVILQVRRDAK